MRGSRLFSPRSEPRAFGLGGRFAFSLAMVGLVLPLSVLHAWLLWQRIAQGRLWDLGVALRWGAGVVLLLSLLALRRKGVSLLWGRRALAFWTLVLLLHWAAPAPRAGEAELSSPAPILFVVPASAGALALVCGLLRGLGTRRVRGVPPAPVSLRFARQEGVFLPVGFPFPLFARPPPA